MTTPPSTPAGSDQAQSSQEAAPRRLFRQLTMPERPKAQASQPTPGAAVAQPQAEAAQPAGEKNRKPFRFMPAFWTITGTLSLIVNLILIIIIVVLANNLFALRAIVKDQLIGGLATNFKLMDQARIQTNVSVSTNVPAKFNLMLDTDTTVKLTKSTPIKNAKVTIITGGMSITDTPAYIILPAGVDLPIHLNLEVPVDQQIPVNLNVPVNIPLSQTELHKPFVGLQEVVAPYQKLLADTPSSWREAICGPKPEGLCDTLLPETK